MIDVETIFDSDREEYEFMQEKKEQPMKEQNAVTNEQAREALDRILNFCEEIDNHIPPDETTGYKMLPDYFIVSRYLNEADYRKQEWISVDDRLPDLEGSARTWGDLRIQPSVRVLCACKQNSGKVFVKEGYCEMWGSRVVWKIPGTVDSVTHWMPLPEPPKMKGGAE